MTALFCLFAALLLSTTLAVLLRPLWRPAPGSKEEEDAPGLQILREQRRELDAARATGEIDEAAHKNGLEELTRHAAETVSASSPTPCTGSFPRSATLGIGFLIASFSVVLYLLLGTPAALDPARPAASVPAGPVQIAAMVERLAARIAEHPDDIEGLRMLGRSYMVLGRFEEAARTLESLSRLRPDDAQVLADQADARASAANGSFTGEPEALVERALHLDPENIKALALAGAASFERQDYANAIARWEHLLSRIPPDGELAESARTMISEARKKSVHPPTP